MMIENKARKAKNASRELGIMSSGKKDKALEAMAQALENNTEDLIRANNKDVDMAVENKRPKAFLDRLKLDKNRVLAMSEGLRVVSSLPDPVGEVISQWKRPNGLIIGQQRVPLGVIAII